MLYPIKHYRWNELKVGESGKQYKLSYHRQRFVRIWVRERIGRRHYWAVLWENTGRPANSLRVLSAFADIGITAAFVTGQHVRIVTLDTAPA